MSSIESAIELLAKKITSDIKADEALKYTQSALNLAHALSVIEDTRQKQQRAK